VWRDAALVAGRDLRIELRSRVTANQVAPFSVLVLVLFAFALDPDRGILTRATPGLYWIVVLLSAVLAIGRASAIDETDGIRDALRLSLLEPAGVFLGKVVALAAELVLLEAVLLVGVAVLYDASPVGAGLLVATCAAATVAIASTGVLYGTLVGGLRGRETLLPLLLLPVLAPVLIGTTRAFEVAFGGLATNGWAWCGLVTMFAVIYLVAGSMTYGALLEDT
jgi:heme exporter protein B